MTESEMKEFINILQTVEDWLYEEGEDETKGVYVTKLEELKQVHSIFLPIIVSFSSLTTKLEKQILSRTWSNRKKNRSIIYYSLGFPDIAPLHDV